VVEINTQIHKILDHRANPNVVSGPVPLREGVASTMFHLLGSILIVYMILSFHCAHGLVQGLRGAHSEPRGVKLPKDVARREANRAHNRWMRAWKVRKEAQSATHRAAIVWGRVPPLNLNSQMRRKSRGNNSASLVSTVHNPSPIQ
jgi:hypothetical protein